MYIYTMLCDHVCEMLYCLVYIELLANDLAELKHVKITKLPYRNLDVHS